MTPKCTCWPKELNQKASPRNIQYRMRPKGPFFGTVRLFQKKNFFPTKGPLQYFGVLRQNGCWKISKGPPFVFFGIVRLFFKNLFFIKVVPIHQYLEILKSFCYFCALDMAPTWAVPGLLFS